MSDPTINVMFSGGPNESVDPRSAPPGTVLAAANQVYDADGLYQVRFGYTLLAQSGAPTPVDKLAVAQATELVAVSGPAIYCYDDTDAAWVERDSISSVGVTHAPIASTTTSYQSWTEQTVGGYRVVAWLDRADYRVRAAIYDVDTGTQISVTVLSQDECLNLQSCVVGSTVIIAGADSASTTIVAWALTLSPLTWSSTATISDSHYPASGGIGVFTICALGQSTFMLAYELFGSPSSIYCLSYNTSFVEQAQSSTSLASTSHGFAAMASNLGIGQYAQIAIMLSSSSYVGTSLIVGTINLATLAVGVQTVPGVVPASGSIATMLGVEALPSSRYVVCASDGSTVWTAQYNTGGVISGTQVSVFNAALASSPRYVTSLGKTLCFFQEEVTTASLASGLQNSYFLVDLLTDLAPPTPSPYLLAVLAPTIAPWPGATSGQTTMVAMQDIVQGSASTRWETTLAVTRAAAAASATGRVGLDLFEVDLTASFRNTPSSLGRELYLSGAYYDRDNVCEVAFAQQPLITGSSTTGTGYQRQYVVTYGWIDAQGNLEESAPSPVYTVTDGSTPNITIYVRTTALTNKQRAARAGGGVISLRLYRTQPLTSGDPNFYYLGSLSAQAEGLNVTTAATVSLVDTTADSAITSQPVLYTVSGELAHDCPETFTAIASHMDRLFGVGADQRTIWGSQIYVDGLLPAWSRQVQLATPDTTEPITALASLYDKLLIFTATRIYVVYGQGPAISGTANDWTEPQRVPSPCGCIEPRSVVNTPMGVMFQSARGLELIGPDLSISFLGLPVCVTTQTYPVCTSAVLVESASCVRFTLLPAPGGEQGQNTGVVLNYDYRRQRWAHHYVLPLGISAQPQGAPVVAAAWSSTFGYCAAHPADSGSFVYRENTLADSKPWADFSASGGGFVPLSVTTAWIKMAGLMAAADQQGWQRVRRVRLLGYYYAPHALNVTINYDYGAQAEQHNWTAAQIAGFVSGSLEQVRVIPARGKCEAIQVTVASAAPSGILMGTGRGLALSGLSFEIRRKAGGYRNLSAAQKG